MKKNKTVVLGAAALCVGMLGFAGCNNQVMGKRGYVPATSDSTVPPMTGDAAVPAEVPQTPAPQTPAPAATQVPAAKPQAGYEPMKPLASSPVTHVPAGVKSTGAAGVARTHVVKSGDTLGHIARQYGVSVAAIMQANSLDEAKARRLQIGQKLNIPAAGSKVAVSTKAPAKTGKTAGKAESKGGGVNGDGTYTVQSGDFPERIAHKLGVKVSELMKANNLTPDAAKRLQVGQKLTVPGKGGEASVPAVTADKGTPATQGTPVVPGNEQLDSVLAESDVKTPTQGVTPQVVETQKADTAAQLGTDEVVPALNQIPIIVDEDTTVEAFAAKHNVSVDKLKELNPGTLPASGKLTKNLLLMVPGK